MPKILIADDDVVTAELLEEILKVKGYSIIGPAYSGEEAYQLAKEHRPTIAILDIEMPGGMDGIEVADKLNRELNIPVIFLTGHDETAIIKRAKRVKPLSFLLKPINERQILAEVEIGLFKAEATRERQLLTTTDQFPEEVPERFAVLTPTEIRVAVLIRKGKTSKEVAEVMGVSLNTVHGHRKKIRKKLGLTNSKENLTLNLLY
ncbi:response regulator receiver domain protein [delta proteobacterium NaphS2]|nr:response regulator receiver domain protein [delta proteobacterium NaphS2]